MKYFITLLKYIVIILGLLLIIIGSFADNDITYQEYSFVTGNDDAEAVSFRDVPPVISNETYKLHGNISNGQIPCEGYKLKLKGSNLTSPVKQLGQYLFQNMPIGHNIIEIYDENDNYLDVFEIIFNEGYADYVDYEHNKIYIDLSNTNRSPEFKDKYEVSFGFDETGKIHFSEMGTYNNIIGDMEFVSFDKTINLYGQIVNVSESSDPLPDITIEIENTDISCKTGIDGDFMLPNVPIKKQRLNFYDANAEYISSVDVLFNIDGSDICLNNMGKIILDVGNSDGRLFTNMQIGFEIDADNKTLRYDEYKIHGNVESPENRTLYSIICVVFALVFFIAMIVIDRKRFNDSKSIEG